MTTLSESNKNNFIGSELFILGSLFFIAFIIIDILIRIEFQERGMQLFDPGIFNDMVALRYLLMHIFTIPLLLGFIVLKTKSYKTYLNNKLYVVTLCMTQLFLLSVIVIVLIYFFHGLGMFGFSEAAKTIPSYGWAYYGVESIGYTIAFDISFIVLFFVLATLLFENIILLIINHKNISINAPKMVWLYIFINITLFIPLALSANNYINGLYRN